MCAKKNANVHESILRRQNSMIFFLCRLVYKMYQIILRRQKSGIFYNANVRISFNNYLNLSRSSQCWFTSYLLFDKINLLLEVT